MFEYIDGAVAPGVQPCVELNWVKLYILINVGFKFQSSHSLVRLENGDRSQKRIQKCSKIPGSAWATTPWDAWKMESCMEVKDDKMIDQTQLPG